MFRTFFHRNGRRQIPLSPIPTIAAPPPPDETEMAMLHQQLLSKEANPQKESPLFSVFPPEVRSQIFSFALTDYEDADAKYDAETLYSRPSYIAARKTTVQLLVTCRAIYRETWFLPFILKEQTHWLTTHDRAPPEYRSWHSILLFRRQLRQVALQQGLDELEINSLHIFAQMYKLEDGSLSRFLATPGLHPRHLTLTIRHTDWWYWESDAPLRFESKWTRDVSSSLSNATREFRIELETLDRKRDQLQSIAQKMCQLWYFKRPDGAVLYADVSGKCHEVSRWSGSSTWQDKRWERDESEPGKITYFILTVTFELENALKRRGGQVSEEARRAAESGEFCDDTLESTAASDLEDLESDQSDGSDEGVWST